MRRQRRHWVAMGVGGAVVVVVASALAFPREVADTTRRSERSSPPPTAPSATETAPPDATMPPAWLAWIAGTLPAGLASQTRDALGTRDVVVVAGDTRWMTQSLDADGEVVDRPPPPYRIPIDAFAVSPSEYAPFVPDALRADVTGALRDGRAILGSSSAELREVGVGAVLVFGDEQVEVGAIVPNEVVGWSEVLVSRETGRRLGIVHDRYLLTLPEGPMGDERFARIMASLIPDTDILTAAPGSTRYVRIASGVNPPVMTKTLFGEFAAALDPANPAFFDIQPGWVEANIVTREIPLLGTVTCHEDLLPPLIAALEEVQARGLSDEIQVYSGCWASRTIRRSTTAPPSQHAYGAAIDINAPQNPIGTTPTFDLRVVRIFEDHGFTWGGGFLYPDGHHFEWGQASAPPG